jgi:outer membrane receptor for ferrienterochelin and colicins
MKHAPKMEAFWSPQHLEEGTESARTACRTIVAVIGMMALSVPAYAQTDEEDATRPRPEQAQGENGPANPPPTKAAAESPEPTKPLPAQVSTATAAAANDAAALSDLSLEGLLNLKITVASKSEETTSEAPSVVTVFTREDIQRLGVRTVEQLLNFVPGFQANPDESDHNQRITVRGRSSTAGESVLMLVDGQRVNDLYFGGINALNHGIPTENIVQVEIIRGPGSALYGANAFLGIVNIKTNRSRTNVTAAAGDMNRRYAVLNLAKSFGDLKLASFAKLYADEGASYPDTTDTVGRVVTAKDPVRAVDSSAALEYRGLYLRAGYLSRDFEGMTCCSSYSRYGADYRTSQARAQGGYAGALTTDIDLDSSVAFQRESYLYLWPQSLVQGVLPSETGTLWKTWGVNANADVQWRLLSSSWLKVALMAGATYAHNRLSSNLGIAGQDAQTGENWGDLYETSAAFFGDPGRAAKRNVFAGYVQTKVGLLSQLSLTVGTRYDRYTDFGTSINPRAALVWTTPFKSDLKLAYGRAFRAPTMYEVGLSAPDLKPETVGTFEVSYVQQISDLAQATADVFYQRLDDVIGYTSSMSLGNTGHYTTKGLELELRTRDVYGARLLGSYTHLWRQADDPGLTAGDFGSVAVDYSWRRLAANVSSTMQGQRNQSQSLWIATGPPLVKKAHALLNLRLQAEIAKDVRAFAMVNNIFDWRYHAAGLNSAFLERGRTFLVGLSADL